MAETAGIPVTCPKCQARYKLAASYSGSSMTCRRCSSRIVLNQAKARRVTTGSSRRMGTRTQIAMGMRTRKPGISGLQVVSGLALVAVLALAVVMFAV